jgi:hypothetical protein
LAFVLMVRYVRNTTTVPRSDSIAPPSNSQYGFCPPSYNVAPPSNNQAATLRVLHTCRMVPVYPIGIYP